MIVVRDQLFPQKPPGSRFRLSRTGVQPSPGSSTIELPSAFAESGAYPPDREPPGSSRQCSLPLACRHPPEGHQIGARKRRTPENTILSQPYCRVSTDRSDREGSQLAASLDPIEPKVLSVRHQLQRECGIIMLSPTVLFTRCEQEMFLLTVFQISVRQLCSHSYRDTRHIISKLEHLAKTLMKCQTVIIVGLKSQIRSVS